MQLRAQVQTEFPSVFRVAMMICGSKQVFCLHLDHGVLSTSSANEVVNVDSVPVVLLAFKWCRVLGFRR